LAQVFYSISYKYRFLDASVKVNKRLLQNVSLIVSSWNRKWYDFFHWRKNIWQSSSTLLLPLHFFNPTSLLLIYVNYHITTSTVSVLTTSSSLNSEFLQYYTEVYHLERTRKMSQKTLFIRMTSEIMTNIKYYSFRLIIVFLYFKLSIWWGLMVPITDHLTDYDLYISEVSRIV